MQSHCGCLSFVPPLEIKSVILFGTLLLSVSCCFLYVSHCPLFILAKKKLDVKIFKDFVFLTNFAHRLNFSGDHVTETRVKP